MSQDSQSSPVQRLRERMEDPRVAEALLNLLDRAPALDAGSASVTRAAGDLPGILATAVDALDEQFRRGEQAGIDWTGRARELASLLELATRPAALATLREWLLLLPQLSGLSRLLAQAPDLIAILADTLDEQASGCEARGLHLNEALTQGLRAALWLGSRITETELERLGQLLRSDVIAPEALAVVSQAATSLVRCQQETCEQSTPERIGTLGLLAALRDPQLQRTLAFAVRFGKCFGSRVGKET